MMFGLLVDKRLIREVVLEQDPSGLLMEEEESVSGSGMVVVNMRKRIAQTPAVKGLFRECCTPVQEIAATQLLLEGRDVRDVARELSRYTQEKVHPDDVRLAATIGLENLRIAHVCGV